MTKKALVTGGAGFIGSHLCESLIKKGYRVICMDNLFSGSLDNIQKLLGNPNFEFVNEDVRNKDVIIDLVKKVDIIYHLAAVVGVAMVVNYPLEDISVNIEGTSNVAQAAAKNGKTKVVFTSSSEVYGKNDAVPLKEDSTASIFGPTTITRWAYGLTKSIGEHLLLGYAENGLPVSILRYFNTYGPRGINKKYANVIPQFINQALAGEDITVHGNGKQIRCFTYIADTVRATVAAGEKSNNQVINVGSDRQTSIKRLALLVKKIANSKSKISYIPKDKVFKKKFEDPVVRRPSIEKAKEHLGYIPKHTLERGLKKTVEWTRKQYFGK